MTPFLHVSDSSYGLLQIVRTVARWFKYVENERVHDKAKIVLDLMNRNLFSRAHDECLCLVDDAMDTNLHACFIVDRVEFLDDFSISFIRECLHGRRYRQEVASRPPKLGLARPSLEDSVSSLSFSSSSGRIAFLCVHVPLYNTPTARAVADDITRSHRRLKVPIIEVGEATVEQMREMITSNTHAQIDDSFVYTTSAAAGHCAGYYIERIAGESTFESPWTRYFGMFVSNVLVMLAIGSMQPERSKRGERALLAMSIDFSYIIPPGSVREFRRIPVMKIGPEIAMRYAHTYDDLPPIMQVFCKVLAVVSQADYYWVPRARVWEVLNDLIAEGVDEETMDILLREMCELYLVKVWAEGGLEYVKFQSPALADVAMDVCTPTQVENICKAWSSRLRPYKHTDFRVPMCLAWFHVVIDPCQTCRTKKASAVKLWRESHSVLLKESKKKNWSVAKLNRWKAVLAGEVEAAGSSVEEVLGGDFSFGDETPPLIPFGFLGVWLYRGPIGLGPLGITISIIAEQIAMEARYFVDDGEMKAQIRENMASATTRYLEETNIVENLLSSYDLGIDDGGHLEKERELIEQLAAPVSQREQIFQKGDDFLNKLMQGFVEPRLDRLRELCANLERKTPLPSFVTDCESKAIKTAYEIMFRTWCKYDISKLNEVDLAQHSLMILATRGWQARATPEPLRHLAEQSVARLRNAVMRKLSGGQLHFAGRQQSSADLKGFLLTTALLYEAQDSGKYEA